jgi:hypothetical protein
LSTTLLAGLIGYYYSQYQSSTIYQLEINNLENNTRKLVIENNETRLQLKQVIEREAVLSEANLNLKKVSADLLRINDDLNLENNALKMRLDAVRAQGTQLASWVLYMEGNSTLAKNAKTNQVEYIGESADVIQYTIGQGGLTYLVSGRYNLSHSVTLSSNSGIIGDGQGTQLFLNDNSAQDLLVIPSGSVNCIVSNLYLNGNKVHNKAGSGITIHGYSWRPIIQHVTIRDCADYGLMTTDNLGEYVYEPIFFDLDVRNCGLDGLNFGFCSDAYGEDIYSEGNAGAGIQHFDVAGTWIHEHATFNFGEYGLVVSESSTDLRFLETHVDKNQRNGMLLMGKRNTVLGAFIFNSGQISPNTYDGLMIKNATDCIVSGCIITDYQDNKTQRRGINEIGGSDYNIIEGNNLSGCIEQSIITGAHDEINGNRGYITENQGVARIPEGSKSIRVQHGCQFTPKPGDVQVRLASNLSNCTQFWVFEVDSSGFTISLDGNCKNPVDFAWSVDRH